MNNSRSEESNNIPIQPSSGLRLMEVPLIPVKPLNQVAFNFLVEMLGAEGFQNPENKRQLIHSSSCSRDWLSLRGLFERL